MKTLVIAEKPDMGKAMANVIGINIKNNTGYIEGDHYIFTWAFGHLVEFLMPDEIDAKYKVWRIEDLPILPDVIETKIAQSTSTQFNIIKKLVNRKDVNACVNACDSDAEGERIYHLIMSKIGVNKPTKRLWLDSKTDKEIRRAFENMKDASLFIGLRDSAIARAKSDYVIGMNFSRLYSVMYNDRISVGRVQTPTLEKLVERENEIKNFKSQPYYELVVHFDNIESKYFLNKISETKIQSKKQLDKILGEICTEEYGVINSIDSERKSIPPPPLFNLSLLQQECNKAFDMSAQETLKIAQALYEKHKLLTYPRTDSTFLRESYKSEIGSINAAIKSNSHLSDVLEDILRKNLKITTSIFDDSKLTSHHAIIPTDHICNTQLSELERKVYELVVKRYLMQYHPNHEFVKSTVIISVSNYTFSTSGKQVTLQGWKEIDKTVEDDILPTHWQSNLKVLRTKEISLQKTTEPPKRYTESTLVKYMETSGLGTSATRAETIEKLKKMNYVILSGKSLIATAKGSAVIFMVDDDVKSVNFTKSLQEKMDEIEVGQFSETEYTATIYDYVRSVISNSTMHETIKLQVDNFKEYNQCENIIGKCRECGHSIKEGKKSYYCSNKTCNVYFMKDDQLLSKWGFVLTNLELAKLLTEGKIQFTSKKRNVIVLSYEYDNAKKYPMKWNLQSQ